MKKANKSQKIYVRMTQADYDRINFIAQNCAKGNMSKWIRYAALTAKLKMLK